MLKLVDARSDESHGPAIKTHLEPSIAELRDALSHLGVAPENTRVLGNATGTLTSPPPVCMAEYLFGSAAAAKKGKYMTGSPDQALSLLGQLETRSACYELLESAEERAGRPFDYVILSRPDLMWFTPVVPFCMHNLQAAIRKRDWVFLMPRVEATFVMRTMHDRMRNCTRPYESNKWLESYTLDQLHERPPGSWAGWNPPAVIARPDRPALPKLPCTAPPELAAARSHDTCARVTYKNPCMPA